jgi:hypothetical protein
MTTPHALSFLEGLEASHIPVLYRGSGKDRGRSWISGSRVLWKEEHPSVNVRFQRREEKEERRGGAQTMIPLKSLF